MKKNRKSVPVESEKRAARNRTLTLTTEEEKSFASRLLTVTGPVSVDALTDQIIHGDLFAVLDLLPAEFAED